MPRRLTKKKVSTPNYVTQPEFSSAMGAIKRDFDSVRDGMKDMRQEMKDMEGRLESKIADQGKQLKQAFSKGVKEIMEHIDVAVENRKTDLLGVSQDEIMLMKEKGENHEQRIQKIETKIGA